MIKPLPKSVQEIADIIGRDNALYLVGKLPRYKTPDRSGVQASLYVPTLQRLTPDHSLSKILGYPLARKMCVHFGGSILSPANCLGIVCNFRNKSIVEFYKSGMSFKEISEILDITPKYTKRILLNLGYNVEQQNAKQGLQNAN